MAFVCEDLAQHGVVLVAPSTDEYFELRADIERRARERPKGAPPVFDDALRFLAGQDGDASTILVNRANAAIVSLAYVWWVRAPNNRIVPHSSLPGTNPSVLLPFRLNQRNRKFIAYWNTIFPRSKRLIACDGFLFGDNTDVRPPVEEELSPGGFISWSGGGSPKRPAWPVRLTLDGVFFEDEGFAGPNKLGSWEHTTLSAEAYLACAALARAAEGKPAEEFFRRLRDLTGQAEEAGLPPPPPPTVWLDPRPPDAAFIRNHELRFIGFVVFQIRKHSGDEATIKLVREWADVPLPKFHKLD